MSNETNNNAADTVAENVLAIGHAVAENAATAEDVAQAAAVVGAAPAKPSTAAKPKTKAKTETDTGAGALKAVGLAACKRHGLAQVWVTEDGQCFDQESNARAHAKNLGGAAPLKVEA